MPKTSRRGRKPQLAGPVSPDLADADRASLRFDPKARNFLGAWKTTIMVGNLVSVDTHDTEGKARAWIGLPGGSDELNPPAEGNGLTIAKGER